MNWKRSILIFDKTSNTQTLSPNNFAMALHTEVYSSHTGLFGTSTAISAHTPASGSLSSTASLWEGKGVPCLGSQDHFPYHSVHYLELKQVENVHHTLQIVFPNQELLYSIIKLEV